MNLKIIVTFVLNTVLMKFPMEYLYRFWFLKQLCMLAYLVSQIYADISLNQLMAYHAQSGHTLAC